MSTKECVLPQTATQMVNDTKFCLNCEKRLPRGRGHKPRTGYCSFACYKAKPPKMAYLEKIHGKPIREIIADTLNRTNNTYVTADLLGISRWTLNRWSKEMNIK